MRNNFEEETNEQPNSSRTQKKRKVETSLEQYLSEYDIRIAKILKKINTKYVRRKKANNKTKISSKKEKPKTPKTLVTGLRSSTRLKIVKEVPSKDVGHIDLEA